MTSLNRIRRRVYCTAATGVFLILLPLTSAFADTSYTIQPGDTLSKIARDNGTTWQQLAEDNQIVNPDLIYIGDTVMIRVDGHVVRYTGTNARSDIGNAPAVSGKAGIAVRFAYAQLGKPYVWAADGPDSFDCSGLTMQAWSAAGVQLAHHAATQFTQTARVSRADLQPGDLIFYANGGPIHHVTMYIGHGMMIAAPQSGELVEIEKVYGNPYAYGRVS